MSNTKQKIDTKDKDYWLYGIHATKAALNNKKRKIIKIAIEYNKKEKYIKMLDSISKNTKNKVKISYENEKYFIQKFGKNINHQGIAIKTTLLPVKSVKDFLIKTKNIKNALAIIPFKIKDPHNLGAILRSAAAFNIKYCLLSKRNSARENQTVAKVSSGGIDNISFYYLDNLSSSLKILKENHWILIALDSTAEIKIKDIKSYFGKDYKIIIIVGSENKGLNNIILNNCDYKVNIPINKENMESINVSCASAIAFYELSKFN